MSSTLVGHLFMLVRWKLTLIDYASQHRGRERVDGRQTEALSWVV